MSSINPLFIITVVMFKILILDVMNVFLSKTH